MLNKTYLFLASLVMLGTFHFSSSTSVNAASDILSVTAFSQEEPSWCWVAGVQSIVDYHHKKISQCQLFKWGKDTDYCFNQTGSISNMRYSFRGANFSDWGKRENDVVSFVRIKTEIRNDRPFLIRKQWKGTEFAHIAPIYGFDQNRNLDFEGVYWIDIKDAPQKSTYELSEYEYMLSNRKYEWTHTLYGMKY